MQKLIVLLDVDETCALSNTHFGQHDLGYRYNDALFTALIQNGITEVYLFTAYTLNGISKNKEDEPIGAPSRLKLIKHLETLGIKVLAVLTILDPFFNQGPGMYYENCIKPFESAVLEGSNLRDKEADVSKQFTKFCGQELEIQESGWTKLKMTQKKIDKINLYNYYTDYLKNIQPNCHFFIILAEDREPIIEDIQVNNVEEVFLLPILVTIGKKIEDYQNPIFNFLDRMSKQKELAGILLNTLSAFEKDKEKLCHLILGYSLDTNNEKNEKRVADKVTQSIQAAQDTKKIDTKCSIQ